MLNLFLGNKQQRSMVLGEVANLFYPRLQMHYDKVEVLNKEEGVWRYILEAGPDRLFQNLEKYFPDIDLFIDSSKDAFWVRRQTLLNTSRFDIRNVIIYKDFSALYSSFKKRNLSDRNAKKVYLRQHKRIMTLIDVAFVVSYAQFVSSRDCMFSICNYLGIEWNDSKMEISLAEVEYNFFGSPSFYGTESVMKIEHKGTLIQGILHDTPKSIIRLQEFLLKVSGNELEMRDVPSELKYNKVMIKFLYYWERFRYRGIRFKRGLKQL